MIEMAVVVGYLAAWAVGKAKRAAGRLDKEIDEVMDNGLDRLHDLVASKLGKGSDLDSLEIEAAKSGEVSERTRQDVAMALSEKMQEDKEFAQLLSTVIAEIRRSASPSMAFDFRQAKGVQVGNNNSQTNTFE
jgi:hypothetical protein